MRTAQDDMTHSVATALQQLLWIRKACALRKKQAHPPWIHRNRKYSGGTRIRGTKGDRERIVVVIDQLECARESATQPSQSALGKGRNFGLVLCQKPCECACRCRLDHGLDSVDRLVRRAFIAEVDRPHAFGCIGSRKRLTKRECFCGWAFSSQQFKPGYGFGNTRVMALGDPPQREKRVGHAFKPFPSAAHEF